MRIATFREVIIHVLDVHIHFDSQSFEFGAVHVLGMFTVLPGRAAARTAPAAALADAD